MRLQAENTLLLHTVNRLFRQAGKDDMQKVPESEMAVAMNWVLKEKATWNAHLRETYQKYHLLRTAFEVLELKQ